MPSRLVKPYGGPLVDLYTTDERTEELRLDSRDWPSWDLTARQLCDLELLLNGGFSPLTGFMTKKDFEPVCQNMRLADGVFWPMPITLDVPEKFAQQVKAGTRLALRDPEGVMIAAMTVEDVWQSDPQADAEAIFGTADPHHSGVATHLSTDRTWHIGGPVDGVERPVHYDYRILRMSPDELRAEFIRRGWRRVVAFQTRNPLHRAHREIALQAASEAEANLLIHPVVGRTQPGDVDHYTRVRCYKAIMRHFPQHTTKLALLPLAMRMAGPREAVWHAIIRRNYGCSHFIVGRDHAGPGVDAQGNPYYGPYEAQELLKKHQEELGVTMVPFKMMVYAPDLDKYLPSDDVPPGTRTLTISGTELRQRLSEGREIPSWFTFPEVARELRATHPPRVRQGFSVFFTGLSGSGKSTVANVLLAKMLEMGGRPVTLLDGDIVRTNLSSELGFSKEHRDINIRRIGYVASEITKNGGIAICAPIAPYDQVRKQVRKAITDTGGFILVHMSTALEVCESRDRKGLYAKARAGIIKEFTGISDPYDVPQDAEVTLDTADLSPEESAQAILLYLEKQGYIGPERRSGAELLENTSSRS